MKSNSLKMSKLVDKILKEVEDSSDDFFQSKYVSKRKEDFEKILSMRKNEVLPKLENGLERIRLTYQDINCNDDIEKIFLKMFSKLYVDKNLYMNKYRYGYFLLNVNNDKECLCDLRNNLFIIDYSSIWKKFIDIFDMNYDDIQSTMNNMLRKYFNLYNITAYMFNDRGSLKFGRML